MDTSAEDRYIAVLIPSQNGGPGRSAKYIQKLPHQGAARLNGRLEIKPRDPNCLAGGIKGLMSERPGALDLQSNYERFNRPAGDVVGPDGHWKINEVVGRSVWVPSRR